MIKVTPFDFLMTMLALESEDDDEGDIEVEEFLYCARAMSNLRNRPDICMEPFRIGGGDLRRVCASSPHLSFVGSPKARIVFTGNISNWDISQSPRNTSLDSSKRQSFRSILNQFMERY